MKNLSIIGMPIWFGSDVSCDEKTFDLLEKDFNKIFKNNIISLKEKIPEVSNFIKYNKDNNLKYLNETISMNKNLYDVMISSFNNNFFPIIIGGDHSLAIGSVAASLDFYDGDVSLIWIDAHTDIHTDFDSPSGNIHGIPVSCCLGRCANKNLKICKNTLQPSNIYYIGCRDNDKSREIEEKNYIDENNIFYCTDTDLTTIGIDSILDEIKDKIKTKYVHISFDFDCIIDNDFPAVNVLSSNKYVGEGGISFNDANRLLEKLLSSDLNICALDLVEYNSDLDKDFSCLKKYTNVLETINKNL